MFKRSIRGMYSPAARREALRLLSHDRSLSSVARQLRISRSTLREWRDRGLEPRRRSSLCPRCENEPLDQGAYALLLGYYLGDGCISRSRRTYSLRVSCDRTYPAIVDEVTESIRAMHATASVSRVRAPGVVVVQNCWNHWPCLFPQHGPGRKHERVLSLSDWQRDIVEHHPDQLVRGLFRSDGARVNNWATAVVGGEKKRYAYPRWQFTNHSHEIRTWCVEALDRLDIPWRASNWKTISVSTRAGVARLDEVVGPKC